MSTCVRLALYIGRVSRGREREEGEGDGDGAQQIFEFRKRCSWRLGAAMRGEGAARARGRIGSLSLEAI
jgi:hypothetical protein